MYTLIVHLVILLTIAVTVLSIGAVVARYTSNRREARIGAERKTMLEAIRRFLHEHGNLEDIVRAQPRSRAVALGALVSAASSATPQQLPRLRVIVQHLDLQRDDLAALHHRDWTRRAHAATRLGVLRWKPAAPELIHALEDPILDVRLAAAHALALMQTAEAVEPILGALALPLSWPLQRCAEILHAMGTSAVQPLLDAQQAGRLTPAATTVAVKVLGMLRAVAAVPVLINCLTQPDDELRVASAKALGEIADARALPVLQAALADKAWPVRSAAAKALGTLRDPQVVPDLARCLADEAWWVRFNAAEALIRLGGVSELTRAVAGHTDRFARDISRQVLEQYGMPVPQAVAS